MWTSMYTPLWGQIFSWLRFCSRVNWKSASSLLPRIMHIFFSKKLSQNGTFEVSMLLFSFVGLAFSPPSFYFELPWTISALFINLLLLQLVLNFCFLYIRCTNLIWTCSSLETHVSFCLLCFLPCFHFPFFFLCRIVAKCIFSFLFLFLWTLFHGDLFQFCFPSLHF